MKNFIVSDKTPLGAKYNELTKCVEFRLRSFDATRVLLCIFDKPQGRDPIMVLNMKKLENDIWYTSVKNYILNSDKHPIYYGFRVFGSNWEYDEKYEAKTASSISKNKYFIVTYHLYLVIIAKKVNIG